MMAEGLLELLPEIQEQIFLYCNKKHLLDLACCSTDYYNLVIPFIYGNVRIKWSILCKKDIFNSYQLNHFHLTKSLSFYRCSKRMSENRWDNVSENFNNILMNCNVNRLTSLDLANCFCNVKTNEKLEYVGKLISLRKLVLCSSSLLDDELAHLLHLTSLDELDISQTSITNNGLRFIGKLSSLVHLSMKDCWMLEGDGYKHLHSLLHLSTLDISWNNISDEGLSSISKLENLKELYLKSCNKITNEGLIHLQNLKFLVLLDVSHSTILNDDGLRYIGEMSHLESLEMSYCRLITCYGFQNLSHLKSLQCLHLRSVNLTDQALCCIGKLNTLKELDISFNRITDEGIVRLSCTTDLRYLDLSHCILLTDISLEYVLNTFQMLIGLSIKGCRKMNMTGKSRIKLVSMKDLSVDL